MSKLTPLQATAPRRIFLQIDDHEGGHDEPFPDDTAGITWCAEPAQACEVAYVREDLAALAATSAPAEHSEREAFEREFPPMDGVSWSGDRYVVDDDLVNSYRADRHLGQWKAWQARAKLATSAPSEPAPAVPDEFSFYGWLNPGNGTVVRELNDVARVQMFPLHNVEVLVRTCAKAPAVPQPEAPAEPSDDPERDEFYRVFDESTKLTGHKPTLFDVWLMARGRMDTSHRTLVTIDLKHTAYDQMQQAASESKWIPPEYYANEWIADCCRWLREGPPVAEVEERRELSDEEIDEVYGSTVAHGTQTDQFKPVIRMFARAILAKSKEKAS